MFNELNMRNTVKEGIDTSEMEFKPLKDFCGQKIRVDGYFFTDGNYGTQVVVVGNGYKINMPTRAVEQFKTIDNNPEMIKAVLDNRLIITGIKMIDTRNGRTTAYELKDC